MAFFAICYMFIYLFALQHIADRPGVQSSTALGIHQPKIPWSSAMRLSAFLSQIRFGTSGLEPTTLRLWGKRAAISAMVTQFS